MPRDRIPAIHGKPDGRKKNVPPLATRWKAGQSGNPKGRPPAGISIKEWLNVMQDWSLDRVLEVLGDSKTPMAQKAAARVWRDACSADRTSSGAPVAGPDVDRICDRTDAPLQANGEVTIRVVYEDRSNRVPSEN